MIKGARIFVSGGAGVIGRELVPRLANAGAKVYVGDLKPRPDNLPPSIRYRQGDLNYLTHADLETFHPEYFIHLAASFERTRETHGFWEDNHWNNVRLSHHLMSLFKELSGLRRVVFASSFLIYDDRQYQFDEPSQEPVSLRESCPVLPRNLTGMAKLAHEIELGFLDDFDEASFSTVSARIFRGYGKESRDVISRWVRMLLTDQPIEIYGAEAFFDYIYAADSAEGLFRLLQAEHVSGVVNLGSGKARRVRDVVDILRTHFPAMRSVEVPGAGIYEASQADMTVFREAIGWMPEHDLERAIPILIAYEREVAARPAETVVNHVLVSSASRKVPLVRAVQTAARKIGGSIRVIAGDLDPQALTSFMADGFWVLPPIPGSEDVGALIAGCREKGVGTIIPTRDEELSFWAGCREQFGEAGIEVVVSPLESVETCTDKLAFARWGAGYGFPFIPAAADASAFNAAAYVVKERYGAGTRRISLNLSRDEAARQAAAFDAPVYQPFVVGREISIDAWLDRDCRVKGLVCRDRDVVENGESRITSTFRDDGIEREALLILEALQLRGPVVLQALIDPLGEIHVIECNPRFGGASTASIEAGLDVFYWSLLEARGARVDEYPFVREHREVRQVRLPQDIYIHGDHF